MFDDAQQEDGLIGSEHPRIPEPMVFDLVRPLGSTRGELEINTLATRARDGSIEWAPEIEYTVRDGLALEFELPVEDSTLRQYKAAVQGTFRTGRSDRFIHGWQAIGRRAHSGSEVSGDALYIAGYRFNDRWSTLNMLGVRGESLTRDVKAHALINANVFYVVKSDLVLGFEMNSEVGGGRRHLVLTPQLHAGLTQNLSVQVGTSVSRERGKSTHRTLTGRLIYTF
ncbi:MAG: hypothetical protein KIT73_08395 [Burkholderiales bacterium]|nr:hypothetical protein [Burkholderiales bacterium]